MATLTVQAPDLPADLVAELDGELIIDSVALEDLLKVAVWHAYQALGDIAEGGGDIRSDDLRALAERLQKLAAIAG